MPHVHNTLIYHGTWCQDRARIEIRFFNVIIRENRKKRKKNRDRNGNEALVMVAGF